MKCPNCGGSNPDYRRVCGYCGTFLERPPLDAEQKDLRDQFLSMSLGVEDLSTIAFSLGIDWHEAREEPDEASRVEMLVRMLADQGRVNEVTGYLNDFKFPQNYAPLPHPYPDNLWLTYVFAYQNVTKLSQLQEMCDQVGIGEAHSLPGEALPHKIHFSPGLHRDQARNRPQRGALSGAIGAYDTHAFPLIDPETDAVEGSDLVVRNTQIFNFQLHQCRTSVPK